ATSNPFILGISTSKNTTSGSSCNTFFSASSPFSTSPDTYMSSNCSNKYISSSLAYLSSSMTSTLIVIMIHPPDISLIEKKSLFLHLYAYYSVVRLDHHTSSLDSDLHYIIPCLYLAQNLLAVQQDMLIYHPKFQHHYPLLPSSYNYSDLQS